MHIFHLELSFGIPQFSAEDKQKYDTEEDTANSSSKIENV